AEEGFERVLRSEPGHVGALGNLGVVYSRTNRTGKAIEAYQRALRVAPNDRGLTLNLGLAHLKQDDHSKALPLFARLVAADPSDNQARELLATCQLAAGRPKEAIESLHAMPPAAAGSSLLGGADARVGGAGEAEAGRAGP